MEWCRSWLELKRDSSYMLAGSSTVEYPSDERGHLLFTKLRLGNYISNSRHWRRPNQLLLSRLVPSTLLRLGHL